MKGTEVVHGHWTEVTLPHPSSLEASIDVPFNFNESGGERDGWDDGIIIVGDRRLLEAVCRRYDD
eukprot:scaffold37288_cov31-Attheya_sp.AAC.1